MQLSTVSVKVKSLIIDIEQLMIQNFYSSKYLLWNRSYCRPNLCKENLRKYSEIVLVRKNILFWFGFFSGVTFVVIIILIILRWKGSVNGEGFE